MTHCYRSKPWCPQLVGCSSADYGIIDFLPIPIYASFSSKMCGTILYIRNHLQLGRRTKKMFPVWIHFWDRDWWDSLASWKKQLSAQVTTIHNNAQSRRKVCFCMSRIINSTVHRTLVYCIYNSIVSDHIISYHMISYYNILL